MKSRNGFVSNSSSSSFIIVVGEIKKDCINELENELVKLHNSEIRIMKGDDLLNMEYYDDLGCDFVSSPINKSDIDIDKYYVIFRDMNEEGDSHYMTEYGDCNYYITFKNLDARVQHIANTIMNSKNLEKSYCNYGAGRNG